MVRLKVDIILVAIGFTPIQAAKNATKTIPIVMAAFRSILSSEALLKALPAVPAAKGDGVSQPPAVMLNRLQPFLPSLHPTK
jgi:hypothetical protein